MLPPASQRPIHFPPARERLGDAVRRQCPPWLSADADDIVQAASLRVVLRQREAPSLSPTPAYLRTVAKNAVIDAARRHGSRTQRHQQAAVVARDEHRDPEQMLLDHELGATIEEHLARLPPARRDAVSLYVRGYGATEIATRFGCPTKRVENLLYRGLRSLRDSLTAAGFTPRAA